MSERDESDPETPRITRPPATTLEGRENQLIGLAVDLAERQLADGTASAQVITHYLKLGSSREVLEQERIRNENALSVAKRENMATAARVEDLYENAINAMRAYAGHTPEERRDDDDDPHED